MKYVYTGPLSGVTLKVDGHTREVMLAPGAEVDLPEKNEYVATLIARGHLTPSVGRAPVRAGKPSAKGK